MKDHRQTAEYRELVKHRDLHHPLIIDKGIIQLGEKEYEATLIMREL
jgi:hypothetical protein